MERRLDRSRSLVEGRGYYLEAGYIYFSRNAASIRAVLGSCVAVCLWDRNQKCGGMNHYLYPSTRDRQKATAKYGNVALAALIRMMDEAECDRADIEAQIFGGGSLNGQANRHLGMQNVQLARRFLSKKGISIVSEDVGGTKGRKVIFDVGTGEVAVIKVHNIRDTDWRALPKV